MFRNLCFRMISNTCFEFQEASFEYLQNEGEKTLLEAMDALDIVFSNRSVRPVSCHDNRFHAGM